MLGFTTKKRSYSKNIAKIINTVLTKQGLHFSFDEEGGTFIFQLQMNCKIKSIRYHIIVKESDFVVIAVSPLGADKDSPASMASMAEFICRANYGLSHGNFEFDMNDGEIRYKCYVDCTDTIPTTEMVNRSTLIPAAMFRRYGDGIIDVIFGNSTAQEAVAKCEGSAP